MSDARSETGHGSDWRACLTSLIAEADLPRFSELLKAAPSADGENAGKALRPVVAWAPGEDYAESFGFQWNRFDVRQKQEDEETFVVKTGVALSDLAGKTILDAGCGGGRYSRVAAEAGARFVVGVDRSRAVDKAAALCGDCSNTVFVQADLSDLPFRKPSFDLVFSIGVLHHGPDPQASFRSIAQRVKPGGRLSVWLYRRATPIQEWINDALRRRTTKMDRETLMKWAHRGAWLGGVPVVSRLLNKVVSFSAHPVLELRVCDTFDWYSPAYQSHHTPQEIREWFEREGFREVRELPPAGCGRLYRWAHDRGLLIGSGVNFTGIRS